MKSILIKTKNLSKENYNYIENQAILIRQCKNKVFHFILDNDLLFDVANKIINHRSLAAVIKQKDINKITGYDKIITQDTFQRLCSEVAINIQNNKSKLITFSRIKSKYPEGKHNKQRKQPSKVECIIRCLCKITSINESYNDLINKLNKYSESSFSKTTVLPYLQQNPYILTYVYHRQKQLQRQYKGIRFKNLGFEFLNVLTYKENELMFERGMVRLQFNKRINISFTVNDIYHYPILQNQGGITKIKRKDGTYKLSQRRYIVNIKPLQLQKQLQISIALDIENIVEETNSLITDNNTLGVDVNQKRHFLDCSDGFYIEKDEKHIQKAMALQKSIAKKQQTKVRQNKTNEKQGKKTSLRQQKCNNRSEYNNTKAVSQIVKHCKQTNITNIVVEDLKFSGKSYQVKINGKKYKINTIHKLLKTNDVKNTMSKVGNKNGINVHLVNPEYTSQTCPVCGCIHENNRLQQETFKCIKCGYIFDADVNAAINIKNRVVIKELRELLEIFEDDRYIGVFDKYDPSNKQFYCDTYQQLFENTNSSLI